MFDHVSITTADPDRAGRFYDAVLDTLGHPRVNRRERAIGYGERGTRLRFMSVLPTDDAVAADNRHWCFRAPSRAGVGAFHAAALANGGTEDGPPGDRPRYGADYYAAFARDPDGNRIEAICRLPEA